MSSVPTTMRNDSARIFSVGCLSMNSLMVPAASIITSTAMTIAATITGTFCTRPTAVITESSEKMMSITAICRMIPINPAFTTAPPAACSSSSPSTLCQISMVLLNRRNRPPKNRIRSRPETPSPSTVNKSLVRRITQAMDSSSRIRVPMASARPKKRAFGCCSLGRRLTRIEMKMMLSMPRTISRAVRVRKATHISGLLSHSMRVITRWGYGCRAALRCHANGVRLSGRTDCWVPAR